MKKELLGQSSFPNIGSLIKLIEYNCGCIGFPADEKGFALIISACIGDGNLSFTIQQVTSGVKRELKQDEVKKLLIFLNYKISAGYSLLEFSEAMKNIDIQKSLFVKE